MHSLFGCEELDNARFNLRSRFWFFHSASRIWNMQPTCQSAAYRNLLTFLMCLRRRAAGSASLFIFWGNQNLPPGFPKQTPPEGNPFPNVKMFSHARVTQGWSLGLNSTRLL